MAFRLPTHLESLVPPPTAQVPQARAWRGTFTICSSDATDRTPQVLCVTAAETDGDNRADLWPTNFFVQCSSRLLVQPHVQAWVQHNGPPLCMFMPDRLGYATDHRTNEARFRAFSRMLLENQMVVVAPWNAPDRLPGAGILIYPTQSSSGLLVGAIFAFSNFPDVVTSRMLAPQSPQSSLYAQSRQQIPYQQYQSTSASFAQHQSSPQQSQYSPQIADGTGDYYTYAVPEDGSAE